MKSSLEITRPANLCTIAEIYRLAGDSLGLSTFTYTQRAPEEAAFVSCALRSFNVMQGRSNQYQSGKPVCELLL